MTLVLILLAPGWPLAAWLYWSRWQERHDHARYALGWLSHALQREREIADLREMVNKERRNTGKAEM
jgi:hypothetical protein